MSNSMIAFDELDLRVVHDLLTCNVPSCQFTRLALLLDFWCVFLSRDTAAVNNFYPHVQNFLTSKKF